MDNIKYRYKDAFAVIGKAGHGPADNSTKWINTLWEEAGDNFSEIEQLSIKDDNGGVFWWGLMDGVSDPLKYMVGCEVKLCKSPPACWEKRIIPAQTYAIISCTPNTTGEAFEKIRNDPNIKIIGEGYEHYPNPSDNSIVEVYCPVSEGMMSCRLCGMPMTKPEDFADSHVYCHHCYANGTLRCGVTVDELTASVRKLIDIESVHPNIVSTPLLEYIKAWLAFDSAAKADAVPTLLSTLIDGQDCDFTGTQWEKEWLADSKVCHCVACVAARKCISDIKMTSHSL